MPLSLRGAACGLLAATAALAGPAKLEFVPTGGMPLAGRYMPQRLALSADKPASVTKLPDGLTAPKYGELKLGPLATPTTIALVLDEPAGAPAKLYVDSNANGDLTDDAAAEWASRQYAGQGGAQYNQYSGGAMVPLPIGGGTPARLAMYRFDPNDAQRAALKDVLLYYSDYAYKGTLELGDATYNIVLRDDQTTGDFSGARGGVNLLIDVNGNGRFDNRGESYDVTKPFNIKGTTYELSGLAAAGNAFEAVKSQQTVAEILPPPDFSPGKPVLPFTARTLVGDEEVKFPESFKGKLVLLDFWATWCGPCIAELPHLTAAYEKFHPRGFEVLGISFDQPDMAEKVKTFCVEHNMPWPQVYEGKFWDTTIGDLYAVDSIPRAFLVDGDTGVVVAAGSDLRGARLAETIERALTERGK